MSESAVPARRRSTPPDPAPIRPFHLPEVEGDNLENGLRVRSMRRAEVPLVSGSLVLDAGETRVPHDRAGVAVLTGDSLLGGMERLTGAELSEALERLGVEVRVSTGWDSTSISFTCVAERLDPVLELLSELVRTASFPEAEVERVRRQRLAAIRQRKMEPARIADDALDRVLFPADHPYSRPLSGREESVEGLARDHAMAFEEARYRPDRAGFVLVGDLRAERVLELARVHFGGWEGRAAPGPELSPVPPPRERPVFLAHRADAVQSEIRIGLPAPARGTDEDPALEVGNAILGGAFTSRLNLNLRERHGFTYGVRSRFAQRRVGGTFEISTAVQTEVTARALDEAMREFEGFVAEGPTEEEVAQARDYLAGIFPLRMETSAQLAGRLAELLIFGLPEDHHHRYRERIRGVTVDGVRAAMGRHVDPARAAVVIAGDADRLAPELEGLELGPIEVER